jgi:hypothetical protein
MIQDLLLVQIKLLSIVDLEWLTLTVIYVFLKTPPLKIAVHARQLSQRIIRQRASTPPLILSGALLTAYLLRSWRSNK